jgi:hypothetical protein
VRWQLRVDQIQKLWTGQQIEKIIGLNRPGMLNDPPPLIRLQTEGVCMVAGSPKGLAVWVAPTVCSVASFLHRLKHLPTQSRRW